ncbi:MAG: helix-turn-helix transcriptional regulator [Gordonibacter sp.]
MGRLKWGTLNKRVRLSVFSFDVHASIVIGFALHWTWVWVTFWSSAFYSVSPQVGQAAGVMTLEPLWLLSLLTNVLGYGALFVLSKRRRVFGRSMTAPLCAGAVTLVGTMLVSYPSAATFGDAASFVYVLGALLTGVGSAVEVVLWGELLSILGARQTIVYSVLATIAGSAFYLLITFLPGQAARFLTALLPVAEMWLFTRRQNMVRNARIAAADESLRDGAGSQPPTRGTVRNALLEIAGISLFFGLSYGVMKGFFVLGTETLITVRDYLNIAALILGAAAILVTTSVFRMDFRHMTYQVALPLMAAGFIFISLDYPLDLIGFAAHQMGYQYFYIIIWALWAILTRKLNMPVARFACISMTALMAGQLGGSIIGAQLISLATDRYTMAIVAACSVFVILLVALFAFESPFPESGWGVFHPLVRDDAAPKFRRSLEALAELRGLSPRETQVFELLAKGRNCSFISAQLVISEETAKTHIKKIYRKFGVHSQQALLDMIELDGKCG